MFANLNQMIQTAWTILSELVHLMITEPSEVLLKPSLAPVAVGTVNGGSAAYHQSCGVDYSSPQVFIPLIVAILSGVWACLNIESKVREIVNRKKTEANNLTQTPPKL